MLRGSSFSHMCLQSTENHTAFSEGGEVVVEESLFEIIINLLYMNYLDMHVAFSSLFFSSFYISTAVPDFLGFYYRLRFPLCTFSFFSSLSSPQQTEIERNENTKMVREKGRKKKRKKRKRKKKKEKRKQ